MVEGAEETLDFLLGQGDKLVLLTKGDVEIQQGKIKATNCRKWFKEEVYVVPHKDKIVFGSFLKEKSRENVWHVGNSMRSDVKPALEAGIKMIYIPCETWAYEREQENLLNDSGIIRLEKIIDIREKYDLLK